MRNGHEKPMLRPAIIIGLGGTGNQSVRRLKKLVQEHYGDTPTLLNFLVADSDEATFDDQNWSPLPPLTEHERLPLYDPQVPFGDVRENPGAYPEIHDWLLPNVDVGLLDRQQGAGQVRMLGRLALYKSFDFFGRRLEYFFNRCQQIQTLLGAAQQYDFNVETDPVVYIISSTCGGQGAGSFVDAAAALRALAASRFPRLNLIGVLTLPSVYAENIPRENWGRVCANAHAAMKEVDYLMHSADRSRTRFRFPSPIERTVTPQSPLFDLCYLLDKRHQRGSLNRPEEVYDQIATQLFLEIGTPFGARSDSVRVNLNTVAGLELDKVFRTGRRYSGFGNHTISFDREKIVLLASLKSAYTTVHDSLLGQSLTTGEMDGAVKEFVSRHRLDESQTDDLVGALITSREVSREQTPAPFGQDRPDHTVFADDLWARLDTFWLRRAPDLRAQMERRARLKLDGGEEKRGVLPDIVEAFDARLRQSGVSAARDLAEALLSRLRTFEDIMRAGQQENQAQAQRLRQEAETARSELLNIARQLEQIQDEVFFREYRQALEAAPYPVHLRQEWNRLPEPIPDPSKYERRIFALGLAHEYIAVRGASFYLDTERRYTLAGTARQETPDWKTIPLLEATSISGDQNPPPRPPPTTCLTTTGAPRRCRSSSTPTNRSQPCARSWPNSSTARGATTCAARSSATAARRLSRRSSNSPQTAPSVINSKWSWQSYRRFSRNSNPSRGR